MRLRSSDTVCSGIVAKTRNLMKDFAIGVRAPKVLLLGGGGGGIKYFARLIRYLLDFYFLISSLLFHDQKQKVPFPSFSL